MTEKIFTRFLIIRLHMRFACSRLWRKTWLCPFHYFGITDVSLLGDKEIKSKKLTESSFNQLVGDERVKHIIEQANYFGHSGDRVKGLIFCSRIDESVELSNKFNQTINPETGRFSVQLH